MATKVARDLGHEGHTYQPNVPAFIIASFIEALNALPQISCQVQSAKLFSMELRGFA